MTYRATDHIVIPTIDILSHTFSSDASFDNASADHPIWIDPYTQHSISRSEAILTIKRLIAGLHRHGFQPGDTLCLQSFNSIDYPLIYLAAIGAGGKFVGSNTAYKPTELKHLFDKARVRWLIVQKSEVEKVLPVALEADIDIKRAFALDVTIPFCEAEPINVAPAHLKCWTELLQYGEQEWLHFDDENLARTTPAVLLSTSGTTGLPKMAVMSHYAIVTQAVMAEYVAGYGFPDVPATNSSRPQVKRLMCLPMFHSFVLPWHITALRRGETTYIMQKFNEREFIDIIEKEAVTDVAVVPTIAQRVWTGQYPKERFRSLREVICAGASLSRGNEARIRRCLSPECRFTQLWGMSETGWITASRYPEGLDGSHEGAVGKLLPNVEAKVVPMSMSEDSARSYGFTAEILGEILVRHPGQMIRYLDSPVATATSLDRDGWLKTGDVGYCRGERWYVVDRVKEMIKVRGWSVSPAEIEASVLACEGVADAAVMGVKTDEEDGEKIVACILPEARLSRDARARLGQLVVTKVQKELASYKGIAEVVIVEDIARTMSGKVLRRVLKERYQKQLLLRGYDQVAQTANGDIRASDEKARAVRASVEEVPVEIQP